MIVALYNYHILHEKILLILIMRADDRISGARGKIIPTPLWLHYFQTTRLKISGQDFKALKIPLNAALDALHSSRF